MAKKAIKQDFPVSQVRRYLEPGPIVLVSSHWQDRTNIMTLGWHTVLEFSPSLVGLMISAGNHSHHMIRESRECVVNLPTTKLTDTVVGIGNTSGADIDKFQKFGLTAEKASGVDAPLIGECHASFECKLHEDALVERYNFFIFEVVKAHVAPSPIRSKTPEGYGMTDHEAVKYARTAIEEMREPSRMMLAAAHRNNHPRDINTWQTMIDVALSEGETGR